MNVIWVKDICILPCSSQVVSFIEFYDQIEIRASPPLHFSEKLEECTDAEPQFFTGHLWHKRNFITTGAERSARCYLNNIL